EEAVSRSVDLASAKADELLPDERVVTLNQVAPPRVSELRRPLRRIDDVGEEQRRQNAIRFGRIPGSRLKRTGQKLAEQCKRLALGGAPDDRIRKRQLHEASSRHPLSHVAA